MTRLQPGAKLIIASHNPGKVSEIHTLLSPYKIETISAAALGLAEPEETESTFQGNAALKARHAAAAGRLPALADDSGLSVEALGGAPGIYSARWAGPAKDFRQAMQKVHDALLECDGKIEGAAAAFVCALSLAWPDGTCQNFVGQIHGTLTWPPRGTSGFGYDPIFSPIGGKMTFGEMSPDEKHAISHRAIAFQRFITACFHDR